MAQRIIATLHATLADGSDAVQGQKVDLSADEAKLLEERGALVPASFDSFAAFDAYKQDVYRGQRGDMTAAGKLAEARSGGIVDLSGDPQANPFIEQLRSGSPGVDDTVALAGDDPDKARQVLQAEEAVSGGSPRKGVVEGLSKIEG